MSAHAIRLTRLFTPEYVRRINAQLVHPAESVVVKPNELESALARPLNVAIYEPHQSPAYFAATLSYGIIQGHPFQDGNKRTAFFIANEYLRAQGSLGLAGDGEVGAAHKEPFRIANEYINTAAGKVDVAGLAQAIDECNEAATQ